MPAGPVQAVPPPPPVATEPKQVPRPVLPSLQSWGRPRPSPPARALRQLLLEAQAARQGLEGLQVPGVSALRCLLVPKAPSLPRTGILKVARALVASAAPGVFLESRNLHSKPSCFVKV